MFRTVTPEVRWIRMCARLGNVHKHVSTYVVGDGPYVLVDTGAHYHRETVVDDVEAITDGAGPDAVVISHGDLPHTGNVPAIRDHWPDVEVYTATAAPEILGIEPAIQCELNTTTTVAGREFLFFDPALADVRSTMWAYDTATKSLFTGDGFGHYHAPGTCDATSAQAPISASQIRTYHRDTFPWLEYTDPDRLVSAVRSDVRSHDVRTLLPIHGRPIVGQDVGAYLDTLSDCLTRTAMGSPVQNGDG